MPTRVAAMTLPVGEVCDIILPINFLLADSPDPYMDRKAGIPTAF
jgi:hypothetical protein